MASAQERFSLLASIRDFPDDDGRRLIYADALEETGGEGQVAYAQFIRDSIQLANNLKTQPFDPDNRKRHQRLWEYLKEVNPCWDGMLITDRGVLSTGTLSLGLYFILDGILKRRMEWHFERGLVQRVDLWGRDVDYIAPKLLWHAACVQEWEISDLILVPVPYYSGGETLTRWRLSHTPLALLPKGIEAEANGYSVETWEWLQPYWRNSKLAQTFATIAAGKAYIQQLIATYVAGKTSAKYRPRRPKPERLNAVLELED